MEVSLDQFRHLQWPCHEDSACWSLWLPVYKLFMKIVLHPISLYHLFNLYIWFNVLAEGLHGVIWDITLIGVTFCFNRCYFWLFHQKCCLWPLSTLLCPLMTSDASDKVLDCLDMLTNTKSRVRSDVGSLGITLMGVWKKWFNRCYFYVNRCYWRSYFD